MPPSASVNIYDHQVQDKTIQSQDEPESGVLLQSLVTILQKLSCYILPVPVDNQLQLSMKVAANITYVI